MLGISPGGSLLSHLNTLLRSRPSGHRQHGLFWSSGARRTLAVTALIIALIWSAAGAVIWQGYRDAMVDGKRTAANLSLATAAYAQQALLAADLVLRSM